MSSEPCPPLANSTRHRARRASRSKLAMIGLPLGLVASGALVWQASYSAFTATTGTPANNWTTGSVNLTDNDSGSALFNATGLRPGAGTSRCITVTYGGSLDLTASGGVKLYFAGVAGNLGQYLTLTVDESAVGSNPNCSDFGASSQVVSNTLDNLAATNAWSNGLDLWKPTANGQTRTYKFTYSVADNNAAAGQTVAATFTWEAQS